MFFKHKKNNSRACSLFLSIGFNFIPRELERTRYQIQAKNEHLIFEKKIID